MAETAPPPPTPTPPVAAPQTTSPPTNPTSSPTPETEPQVAPSLLDEPAPKDEPTPKEPVPDSYSDFKVPEGFQLDTKALEEATPIFKELGLSQEGAQKLVDFYAKQAKAVAQGPYEAYQATRADWRNQVTTKYGQQLPEVKATIGRGLAQLPDSGAAFRAASSLTGAGDNPAIVEAFYELSKLATEGRPMTNGKPHVNAAKPDSRPSPALAMFPNLPSATAS